MKDLVGFGNMLLLALNLSALGTITYNGRFWRADPPEESPAAYAATLLNLSPAQSEEMEVQREAFLSDWERYEPELQASRGKLLKTIGQENPDPELLWSLVDEITRLQSQVERQAVERLLQEKEILTPQQNERYLSQLENRMRQGMGRMRRYRGGRNASPERSDPTTPSRRGKKGQGRGQLGRW